MQLSASISFMFQEVPLLARFEAARAAGFAGVEIQRLAEGEPDEMARAAREARVTVVLANVSAADYLSGGDGLSGVPGREDDFREAFECALDAATTLGARHLHLAPSRIPAGATRDECLRTYLSNIRTALSISRADGTPLLIEAMNRVEAPMALLADVPSAVEVLKTIGSARLGLQFDLYHATMNGDDPLATYLRHSALVRHIQFADVPGRHEPGTGRLDITMLLQEIERSGYAGWFGAEYNPRETTTASLAWLGALHARGRA